MWHEKFIVGGEKELLLYVEFFVGTERNKESRNRIF